MYQELSDSYLLAKFKNVTDTQHQKLTYPIKAPPTLYTILFLERDQGIYLEI